MHALVKNEEIIETRNLREYWWDGTRYWDFSELGHDPADHGWLPLVYADRPADTATTTWDRDEPRLIDGVPTVTWTERPKTAEELAAEQAAAEYEATRLAIRAIVLDIKAEKDRAQAVIDKANANLGPADTKDLARAIKRMADANIDLAKFVRDL